MTLTDQQAEAYIAQKIDLLPEWLGKPIRRLREGRRIWLRVVIGILLIASGLLWFLPILGIWMLPLGALLLADQFPPLKRWLVKTAIRGEDWWRRKRGQQR